MDQKVENNDAMGLKWNKLVTQEKEPIAKEKEQKEWKSLEKGK